MTSYVSNLDNYEQLPDSNSCYLDGRYFQKVFQKYPGLILEPLYIYIDQEEKMVVAMNKAQIDSNYPGILRVIIQTPTSRHSNLLILDYDQTKAYYFEPLGQYAPHFDLVQSIIKNYLHFFDLQLETIQVEIPDVKNPACDVSGYCLAYVVLYAYAFLTGQDFNPNNIRKFVTQVEQTYGPLPPGNEDVEMGYYDPYGRYYDNRGERALVGGLAGGALGGLAFGAPGLLLGGLGGAAIGAGI